MSIRCRLARGELRDKLFDEVVGPGSGEILANGLLHSYPDRENEVITDLPEDRYYVGVLFPTKDRMNIDNDDSVADTGNTDETEIESEMQSADETIILGGLAAETDVNDDTMDEVIALSMQDRPSSIGMTFIIDRDAEHIVVDVSFATYKHTTYSDCMVPFSDDLTEFCDVLEPHVFLDGGILRLKHALTGKDVKNLLSVLKLKNDTPLARALYKLVAQCNPRKGFKRVPHFASVSLSLDGNPKSVSDVSFAYLRAVKNVQFV